MDKPEQPADTNLLLLRAAMFAADRHRDQRRKDEDGSPYINHPLAVACLLAADGGVRDVELLTAALLHDTVEDTETTPAEIEQRFGARVRQLVEEVTDDKSRPKAERKALQIEHASRRSDAAKLLKIADKTCNVRDIANSPPAGWSQERRSEYLDWAERVVAGCKGANPALERAFDLAIAEARRTMGTGGAEST